MRQILAAATLAALLGCGAPESRPAAGDIAERVLASLSDGTQGFDNHLWDDLLRAAVRDGRIDYSYLGEHRTTLDLYLAAIANADLEQLAPSHLEALLLNAYNALTVASILDHPEVTSIRQISGVWDKATHRVGGYDLTLDGIEHNLLRPFFKDPRVHFVVNCASTSCAALPPWAFDGEKLEEQIEARTRVFLRDPQNVRMEKDVLNLSAYFDWYAEDFTMAGWSPRAETIPAFIALYAEEEIAAALVETEGLRLRYFDYDWSLNSLEGRDR